MTNSLPKDSHIPLYCRPMSTYDSGQGASKNREKSVAKSNSIRVYKNEPADKTNFCGFLSPKNVAGKTNIYTSEKFKNLLLTAADKPTVFTALFALPLTCILRPTAIMALPGDKKHKDDKKYAAAHSVASGAIGWGISTAIFDPLGNAMKKIGANPADYLKKYPKLAYLYEGKNFDRASKYMNMLPDVLVSAPRAVVTIALIPPILKYVFGWEKKKPVDKQAKKIIAENPSLINFKNSTPDVSSSQKPSFSGSYVPYEHISKKSKFFEPLNKFFSPITNLFKSAKNSLENTLADGYCKILGKDITKNVVEKSKSENLAAHLTAVTGFTLSSFYIHQTLKNKELESEKRKTLAINQGVVWVLSTVAAYTVNKVLGKRIGEFSEKFMAINSNALPEVAAKYKSGIKTASSLMIFGTIYRFLAPVFATPIANYLGTKMQENDKKKADAQQASKVDKQ